MAAKLCKQKLYALLSGPKKAVNLKTGSRPTDCMALFLPFDRDNQDIVAL